MPVGGIVGTDVGKGEGGRVQVPEMSRLRLCGKFAEFKHLGVQAKAFLLKSICKRLDRLQISGGIAPENELSRRVKYKRLLSCPIEDGNGPVKVLLYKFNSRREADKFPIDEGSVPTSLLPDKSHFIRLVSREIEDGSCCPANWVLPNMNSPLKLTSDHNVVGIVPPIKVAQMLK